MEQYIIRHRELRELLLLIASVIRKPICFYDVRGNCLTCPPADSAPSGEYCMERRRKDPAFLDACIRCDMEHIRNAEKTGIISVYRCHAGLYDCVVPIFNPDGRFPGGFIVGQQRAAAAAAGPPGEGSSSAGSAAATPPALAHETQNQKILYEKLDEVTSEQLLNVGRLLKHLSEYLLSHELVGCRKLPWANAVDRYLKNHCDKNVTLDEVARAAGCSKSFLTHRFRSEFHVSFKEYQRKLRMEFALAVLKEEHSVKSAAEKTGFPNQFTFSKMFKQYWGIPPSHCL